MLLASSSQLPLILQLLVDVTTVTSYWRDAKQWTHTTTLQTLAFALAVGT
jgi:hypothetical protein